jgi:hypothetical protein
MFKSTKAIFVLLLMFTAVTLACGLPSIPGTGNQPAATVTPIGDMLIFNKVGPTYVANLSPGEQIPGTQMEYIGKTADGGYEVSINGTSSVKRTGDSFIWSGIIAPGTHGQFNLRISTDVLGELPVAGSAAITVLNPEPFPLVAIPEDSSGFSFTNILTNYTVPAGSIIPGTTLTYQGVTQQGGVDVAQINDANGAASYYAQGDSVVWTGKLRENVFVRYNLRIISYNAESLLLGGTAELFIRPSLPAGTQ